MKRCLKIIVGSITILSAIIGAFLLIQECIKVKNFMPDINYENMI